MAVREAALKLEVAKRKERSPWADALRQLLLNKVAVASGIFIIFVTLLAFVLAPYVIYPPKVNPSTGRSDIPYDRQTLVDNYSPPGGKYLLGADALGRDVLTRTVYGARVSLSVAFVAATVSLIIGMTYGLVSGYLGGMVDNVMMRIVDILYGFPSLIFVILLQVYFKALSRRGATGIAAPLIELDAKMGGMLFIFVALGALNWIAMARIARGQVLSYKEKEFIEAARMVGAGNARIIFRHLLPNILGPCIVYESLMIPAYIFTEAFLSFIGLGVTAPTPSWGIMVNEGYRAMRSHAHVLWPPAIALTITTLAFNFLGDGLRDAFDPRMRGTF
ncbi:MAG: ABC transporter permease [Chloroflexota bacterium]|nr:ABC transporter permease [Chloroflexota bacterium]